MAQRVSAWQWWGSAGKLTGQSEQCLPKALTLYLSSIQQCMNTGNCLYGQGWAREEEAGAGREQVAAFW